jgi:hypothetical protein
MGSLVRRCDFPSEVLTCHDILIVVRGGWKVIEGAVVVA